MAAVIAGREPAAPPRVQHGRLRVGLFASSPAQPRWIVEAFDKVARSDFAELARLEIQPAATRSRVPLAWRLYAGIDRLAFDDDLCAPVELSRLRIGALTPNSELDVAFVLDEGVDERRLAGVARCGVWRFWFGEERGGAASLAGWREVVQGRPAVASGIGVRLAPDAPLRVAYQSWLRTYSLSPARTRARLFRKTAEFAWRALRDLHCAGPAWLEQCPLLPQAPGAAPRVGSLAAVGGRILKRGLEKALCVEQWFLAFRFGAARVAPGLEGWTRLVPAKDRFWADPFALEKHGRYYVFFEELPFAAGKAHISMIEVKADGSVSPAVRVLERDYHLSYPFLIEDGGELYMIPESAQAGAVELYRCVDFPRRWKLEQRLLEGVRLVDATLLPGRGRWWMFANGAVEGSRVFDDELHLFHAPGLKGPWVAHARNPVKSDAHGSRPAGRLMRCGGRLIRPAQVCVPTYGAGLSLQRVLRLTPQEYEEHEIERVMPEGGLLGLHTLNRAGALVVTDAFVRRSRFRP